MSTCHYPQHQSGDDHRHRAVTLLFSTMLAGGVAMGQFVPADFYGDAEQGSCMLRRNDGQVFDTDGNQRPDVKAVFEASPVDIALRDPSRIAFFFAAMNQDSVTTDTTYRVDLSTQASGMYMLQATTPAGEHYGAKVVQP